MSMSLLRMRIDSVFQMADLACIRFLIEISILGPREAGDATQTGPTGRELINGRR